MSIKIPHDLLGNASRSALVVSALLFGSVAKVESQELASPPAPADASRETSAPARTTGEDGHAERSIVRVDLGDLAGSPAIGPDDAPVTIVSFLDYQCPFCARAHATLEEILEAYGDQVRIVFKQNPLERHPEAELAAQAALVAMVLGEFPRMHELLLEHQRDLNRQALADIAEASGLDRATFESALDSGDFATDVEDDRKLAKRLGITSTPFFFVNGRPVRGAQPFETFKALIDEEIEGPTAATRWVKRLEKARSAQRSLEAEHDDSLSSELKALTPSTPTEAVLLRHVEYLESEIRDLREEIRALRTTVAVLASQRGRARAAPSVPRDDLVSPIADLPLDDSDPSLGGKDAPVVIVAFADYGCPYSRKFTRYVLPSIRERFIDSGRVRYVFRDRPLDYHPKSMEAAIAANCAGRQGAYWKMHDALFALDGTLEDVDFEAIARELGLDSTKFAECVADSETVEEVEADVADASSDALGLRVVPSFLIGRQEGGKLVDVKRVSGVQTVRALRD